MVPRFHEKGIVHGGPFSSGWSGTAATADTLCIDIHTGNVFVRLPDGINNLTPEEIYQIYGESLGWTAINSVMVSSTPRGHHRLPIGTIHNPWAADLRHLKICRPVGLRDVELVLTPTTASASLRLLDMGSGL